VKPLYGVHESSWGSAAAILTGEPVKLGAGSKAAVLSASSRIIPSPSSLSDVDGALISSCVWVLWRLRLEARVAVPHLQYGVPHASAHGWS
jgi:hypothetical protein